MRAVVLIALVALIATGGGAAADSGVAAQLADREAKMMQAVKAGRHADALVHAREALRLSVKSLGKTHEKVARHHDNIAELSVKLQKLEDAARHYAAALAIRQRLFGDRNGAVALTLLSLAQTEHVLGRHEQAAAHYQKALDAFVALHGPDDGYAGRTLMLLGRLRGTMKQPREALVLLARALQIAEKVVGRDHTSVGEILADTAEQHAALGAYARAVPLLERSLAIFVRAYGPDHRTSIGTLDLLAFRQRDAGRYAESLASYGKLLAAQKAARLGDAELGRTSVNTGLVLKHLGRLEEATRAYRDGIAALERAYGPKDATVAKSLGNLANVLAARGQYPEARAHLDRAVELWRALHGDDHIDTATALNNLSALLKEMGDLASALPMTRQVLATFEKHYGPRSDEVAVVTDNLASLLGDLGRYEEAEPLYRRALAIHEERLGKDHPAVATGLNNIGWLLRVSGRAEQSLSYFERALAINLAKFGKKHPTVAASHGQLGVAFGSVGKLEQARLHLGKAKRINEKALGRSHPNLALVMSELAQIEAVAKRSRQARTLSERSLSIVERHLEPLLYATSQRERLELVGLHRRKVDLFLSLHGGGKDARRAYDRVLRWKAIVLTSLVAQRQAVLASSDGALANEVAELARVRTELANLSMAVPAANERGRVTARLAFLGQRKDRLERDLSARSAAFGAGQRAIDADYRAVCKALEPGRALVDYYRYLRTGLGGARAWHVVAFVSAGGRCKNPVRVELGRASAIDEAVAELRAAVEEGGQTEQVLRAADRVRALAWDPLASALGDKRWVWLSTDGSLNEVPFAALPVRGTIDGLRARFLIEGFTFSHVASGKEILRHARSARGRANRLALIVGGLHYGSGGGGKDRGKGKGKGKVGARAGSGCGIQSRPEFDFLSGSEAEATSVRRALSAAAADATLLSGARGDEKTIKSELGRSNLVHLATHGFFARPCAAPGAGAEDQALSNPLLRSGIVLSGANATRGRAVAGGEDGVLTAEEVAALDLRQLELAVLSACETALGDIASGEGVLGLRWAFAIAGTRALVMSLWKVPDAETRALMTEFYRAAGSTPDRPAALRSAQLAMLRARRAEGDPNPWSWAAFIASGR